LTPLARQIGLVDDVRWRRSTAKESEIEAAMATLEATRVGDSTLGRLLRRPETSWADAVALAPALATISREAALQVEYDIKYAGYVARQEIDVARQRRLADKRIPRGFDFARLTQLRTEAREKLSRVQPASLSQATRISGITPADIALLLVHLDGKR
jgi:tRNA uridine 5-carboxymethylaminomethyl modification enzyme